MARGDPGVAVRVDVGGHAPLDLAEDAGAVPGDLVALVEAANQFGAPVQQANGVVAAEREPVE